MKPITRTKIYLPVAAVILTAALAGLAAAKEQVPFKGIFQGTDTVTPPTIATTATGTGTHVGQFSLTDVSTLTTASGGTGTGHWIAANGDSIDTTFVGIADFSTASLGYITVTEMHTITGWNGSIRWSAGELYRTPDAHRRSRAGHHGHARHLRLIRRGHYFRGRSSLRGVVTRAEKRCRPEVFDSISSSAGEPAVAPLQARPGGAPPPIVPCDMAIRN